MVEAFWDVFVETVADQHEMRIRVLVALANAATNPDRNSPPTKDLDCTQGVLLPTPRSAELGTYSLLFPIPPCLDFMFNIATMYQPGDSTRPLLPCNYCLCRGLGPTAAGPPSMWGRTSSVSFSPTHYYVPLISVFIGHCRQHTCTRGYLPCRLAITNRISCVHKNNVVHSPMDTAGVVGEAQRYFPLSIQRSINKYFALDVSTSMGHIICNSLQDTRNIPQSKAAYCSFQNELSTSILLQIPC